MCCGSIHFCLFMSMVKMFWFKKNYLKNHTKQRRKKRRKKTEQIYTEIHMKILNKAFKEAERFFQYAFLHATELTMTKKEEE